jgi:hypothetical protein
MHRFRSPLTPSVLTIASAVMVCAATFLPWYQTAIGPLAAPDTSSGWDATEWAKLAVAAAAIYALCAAVIALDIRGQIALHGPVRRLLAGIALGAGVVVCAAILYRLAVSPDPAVGATREFGLILASLAGVAGLYCALAQFAGTSPGPDPRRAPRRPRRRPDMHVSR